MPRRSKFDQELSWLRALWEEMAAAEMVHGCYCSVVLRPTASKGVFTVSIEGVRPEVSNSIPPWQYTTMVRYPNGNATEFLSWLWGRMNRWGDEAALSDNNIPSAPLKEG